MNKSDARNAALSFIKAREQEAGCGFVLLDEMTQEQPFGWVFFYDSSRHVETGDVRDAVAGNAPVVVTRSDGRVHETGSGHPLDHYLKEFDSYEPDREEGS